LQRQVFWGVFQNFVAFLESHMHIKDHFVYETHFKSHLKCFIVCILQAIRMLIEKSKVLQKEIVAQGRVCIISV